MKVRDAMSSATHQVGKTAQDISGSVSSRTLWHSLYDQRAAAVEVSFYLGEKKNADGSQAERRSDYVRLHLRQD